MTNNAKLMRIVHDVPATIAVRFGYEKLTSLHNKWISDMVFDKGDKTLLAHRGSFKTTCLIIAFAFIMLLFPERRIIFIRKTDTDVAEVMNATANVLKTPYFQAFALEFYGEQLKLTTSTQSAVNTNFALGVSGAPQLLGLGLGASLTGKHADDVFTDDIVNIKDRVSHAERERTKLIYQELQNIRNRGGRIRNTGTPWHKDDALTLMPNIERLDCYSTGLITRKELETIRDSMSPSLFAANYELKHIADEDAMFTNAQFFDDKRILHDAIGHIDAAYGGEDGTAFTVIKRVGSEFYVYGRLWQRPVDEVLPIILTLAKALKVGTIYTEKNADKGYLAKDIANQGHPAATYSENTNKYIKISTYLKGAWLNIRFLDCDDYPLDAEYLNQILDYTENAEHDDAPDSLACGIRKLSKQSKLKTFKTGI